MLANARYKPLLRERSLQNISIEARGSGWDDRYLIYELSWESTRMCARNLRKDLLTGQSVASELLPLGMWFLRFCLI